ncbi:hypothetical protein Belba_2864 [Belliella baltica DSM 15883]|uniref:Uncharacterized protein n=1 Tax=Belliella baltica (strain DSM 15883 / CIP 108006 / LMG 21964 / BA134) TaxID=866536 RepID=I3Z828_BELBD|nr:hypothetical protein [Belliella baltica]AFL85396.1 hypothetical protein Belba_2864 [Belliella baltica DSM 15883]
MTGHETVQELLIENDGDIEQLARIFGCSISTLKRVLNKETFLTVEALSEFKEFLFAVKIDGKNILKENDPRNDYWIIKYKNFLNKYIYWAGGLVILGVLIGASVGSSGGDYSEGVVPFVGTINLFNIVLIILSYLFVFGILKIWPYQNPEWLYIENINPIFEVLI